MIPGDGTVIEICDTHIQQDIEYKGEVEQRKIKSIHFLADTVLYSNLNTEKPEGFDQQVKEDQKGKVGNEFFLQTDSNLRSAPYCRTNKFLYSLQM